MLAYEVYDDVAFFWFLLAFIGVVIVPWTIAKVVSFMCSAFSKEEADEDDSIVSLVEGKKVKLPKSSKKAFSTSNIIFFSLWVVFIGVMILSQSYQNEQLAVFDPYAILGLDRDATPSPAAIKKAYHKLSLQFHPDKNPGDREAEQKFVLVAKAYQTLTDEKTRENYEKYGNPDGFQGTSVTIGLPSFLTSSKHSKFVLLVYFIALVIALPVGIYRWWNRVKSTDPQGISIQSMQIYYQLLAAEFIAPKFLIEILSLAIEYSGLGLRGNEIGRAYAGLFGQVKEDMGKSTVPKQEPGKAINPYIIHTRILSYCWLNRLEIPDILKPDLEIMLQHVHALLKRMLHIALSKNFLNTSLFIVDLSQCFTQAMRPQEEKDVSLLQLPHFDQNTLLKCKKSRFRVNSIDKLASMSEENRLELLNSIFTPEQSTEINQVCTKFPVVDVKVRHFVPGTEKIVEHDVVTVKIDLKRLTLENQVSTKDSDNLESIEDDGAIEFDGGLPYMKEKKKEKLPSVKAFTPRFPFPKAEGWLVILYDITNKRLAGFQPVSSLIDNYEVEMKIQAQGKGTYDFAVYVKSDCYRFIDKKVDFKLKVHSSRAELEELAKSEKTKKKKDPPVVSDTSVESLDGDDSNVDEEEEEEEDIFKDEEPESYWYYLGLSSIWELLIVLFFLYVAALVFADWLHIKGYIKSNPFKSNIDDPRFAFENSHQQTDGGDSYYSPDEEL